MTIDNDDIFEGVGVPEFWWYICTAGALAIPFERFNIKYLRCDVQDILE